MHGDHRRLQKMLLVSVAIIPILIFGIGTANAQLTSYTPLESLPCIGNTCYQNQITGQVDLSSGYIKYMFALAIALAAAAAVFMIVLGGLQYMTTDSWQGKSAGLDRAKNALYGLLLVLCSYLILRTINPGLVAIPTTLVAPLKIDSGGSLVDQTSGLIKSASDELNAYLATNIAKDSQDVAQAQQTIATTNSQTSDLISTICGKYNITPATTGGNCSDYDASNFCENLSNSNLPECVSLASSKQANLEAQSTKLTSGTDSIMSKIASGCQSSVGTASWTQYNANTNNCISTIESNRTAALTSIQNQIGSINAPQATIATNQINNSAYYNEALVKLAAYENSYSVGALQTQNKAATDMQMHMNEVVYQANQNITDPNLKAQLMATANSGFKTVTQNNTLNITGEHI